MFKHDQVQTGFAIISRLKSKKMFEIIQTSFFAENALLVMASRSPKLISSGSRCCSSSTFPDLMMECNRAVSAATIVSMSAGTLTRGSEQFAGSIYNGLFKFRFVIVFYRITGYKFQLD